MASHAPSADQAAALDRVAAWFGAAPAARRCEGSCDGARGEPHTHGRAQGHPVLAIGGLAGSGKTWLAGQLAGHLGRELAYGTPTHQAAAVLRRKLPPGQASHVRTYHSLLFRTLATYHCGLTGAPVNRVACGCPDPDDCTCERRFTPCGRGGAHACPVREQLAFQIRQQVQGFRDLIVLDEASMVTERTVAEIRGLGLPVLLVGDHGQLPPVQAELNPWMRAPDVVLAANHRQGEASGIVAAALRVRLDGHLPVGLYGDGSTFVGSAAARPELLAAASPERLPADPRHAVICHTNAMRGAVNRLYHEALGLGELPLAAGDRLVALQNGDRLTVARTGAGGLGAVGEWSATGATEFVFNGATGTVEAVAEPLRLRQAWRDVVVRLDCDARGGAATRISTRVAVAQLGAAARLRPDQHAEGHALWDYAYALTAHKAQGSEYDRVVVLDTHPPDWRRWLYTAMTRAREKLIVLNWSRL